MSCISMELSSLWWQSLHISLSLRLVLLGIFRGGFRVIRRKSHASTKVVDENTFRLTCHSAKSSHVEKDTHLMGQSTKWLGDEQDLTNSRSPKMFSANCRSQNSKLKILRNVKETIRTHPWPHF